MRGNAAPLSRKIGATQQKFEHSPKHKRNAPMKEHRRRGQCGAHLRPERDREINLTAAGTPSIPPPPPPPLSLSPFFLSLPFYFSPVSSLSPALSPGTCFGTGAPNEIDVSLQGGALSHRAHMPEHRFDPIPFRRSFPRARRGRADGVKRSGPSARSPGTRGGR